MKKILATSILLLISLIPILYFNQGTSQGSEGVSYLSKFRSPQAENRNESLDQAGQLTPGTDATNTIESPIVQIATPAPTSDASKDPGATQTAGIVKSTSPAAASAPTPARASTIPKTQVIVNNGNASQIEMLGYINAARVQANLAPLVLDSKLSDGACLKAEDMAVKGYFSHTSPTYGSPFEMMTSLGIKFGTAGENIAKNFSVKGAHDAFMNSPGHKANLLDPEFQKIGLGFYQSGNYLFVTQWFTD
jgi:uncharacterized protein YkwD